MTGEAYRRQMIEEAAAWNRAAEAELQSTPPDWRFQRQLLPNAVVHAPHLEDLWERVEPGMHVLELGCGSGWLALEMARRGACVLGVDVADRAIEIARAYAASSGVGGRLAYLVADLNHFRIPAGRYDLVVAKGILHHLPDPADVVDRIHAGLRAGGWLWVSDTHSDEALSTAACAGLVLLVLPSHISYHEKLAGLLRFGWRTPARIRASMQAEGLSPFEGAGRQSAWLRRIGQRFEVQRRIPHPALTGYLAHQIALPRRLALPLLRLIRRVDSLLVRLGLLHSSSVTLLARKPATRGPEP